MIDVSCGLYQGFQRTCYEQLFSCSSIEKNKAERD
jgi:hypothetical protein